MKEEEDEEEIEVYQQTLAGKQKKKKEYIILLRKNQKEDTPKLSTCITVQSENSTNSKQNIILTILNQEKPPT